MHVRALLRTGGADRGNDGRLDAGADTAADAAHAARERAHGLLRDLLADLDGGAAHGGAALGGAAHGGVDASASTVSLGDARLRRVGRGPVLTVLAAGLLSFSGVAAASTQVSGGNPLYGLGAVVRAATGSFLGPGGPARPRPPAGPSWSATQAAPPPEVGVAVNEQQVDELLRRADELLVAGRVDEARAGLERAEQLLGSTPGADTSPARDRATKLRDRLEANGAGTPSPGDDPGKARPVGDDPEKAPGEQVPARPVAPEAPSSTAPAPDAPARGAPEDSGAASTAPAPKAPVAQLPAPPAPTTQEPTSKAPTSKAPTSKAPTSKPPTHDDDAAGSGAPTRAPSRRDDSRSGSRDG